MIQKQVLIPERVRLVPQQFSWLDHRLVQDNHLRKCPPQSLALYLFLVIVSDAQGLSYYSQGSIGKHLGLEPQEVLRARQFLLQAGLVAYQRPIYQVLDLNPEKSAPRSSQTISIKELFERALKQQEEVGHD